MHPECKTFTIKIRDKFPDSFLNKTVLDVGSWDVNGSNKDLFKKCNYTGIDIAEGKNMDIVTKTHEHNPGIQYDTIISTECFEHDMHYKKSLKRIVELLKSGGLFLFTCATTGRPEHGTKRTTMADSLTANLDSRWSMYYKNLTMSDIREAIDINIFKEYEFQLHGLDLYFYGVKK